MVKTMQTAGRESRFCITSAGGSGPKVFATVSRVSDGSISAIIYCEDWARIG